MALKRCRKCGFAYWLGKLIKWNENGTITMTVNPDHRVVIIEADFLTDLFTLIEERLGLSVTHLVFEAQRNVSVWTIDSQLNKFPYLMGRWGPNKRLVVRVFCDLATWLGQAYARSESYHPHKGGEAVIRNPYNRELMAAIILGAFESLERRPFKHQWIERDGEEIFTFTAAEAKPEISERLMPEYPPLKPGNFYMPRCPSCGVPIELSYLRWREEEGIIVDSRRDIRVAFLDGFVPTVVFNELGKELGDDVYPLILQAEMENTTRRLRELGIASKETGVLPRKERESIYENTLATLPLRGQGNPVGYEYTLEKLEVTVENPYNEHLLAGQIAALYEAVEGRAADITWQSPEPSSLVFTVRPR